MICRSADNCIRRQAYAASPEWTNSPSFGHMHDVSAAAPDVTDDPILVSLWSLDGLILSDRYHMLMASARKAQDRLRVAPPKDKCPNQSPSFRSLETIEGAQNGAQAPSE